MQTPSNANPVEGERHGGEGQTRELQEIPHPIENPDPIQTMWKRSAMASKRNMVSWKEHLGKSKLRGCSLQLNAEKMMIPAVRRRKETAAAALVAAGFTEHPIMARQSTRRRVEVLRAANDGSGIDTLDKPPNGVGSSESCNEEALGERQINLRFSSESRSDEQTQTAEDSGSKQVASSIELLRTTCKDDTAEGFTMSAGSTNFQMMTGDWDTVGIGLETQPTGEKESSNSDAENSVEDNAFACALIDNSECAAALMENEHSTAYDPPEGKKLEACQVISCSLERETNEQGLFPTDGFTMREAAERSTLLYSCEKKMGEEDDSQVVEDIILLDCRDEKMRDVGSQCSDEKMREYGGLDRFGSEDLGDADSDIIYLEGFPSSDEMEEDDSSDEDAICRWNYSDEETSEDEGSEQHHGFDDNTEGDDACEQPQGIEVDDGNTTFKEIDGQTMSAGRTFAQWTPSFEAFLCPEDRERILKLGLGTHMLCKKPSGVSWHFFPEPAHTSSYYRFSNVLPIQAVFTNCVSNENSAEYSTHEEKSGGSDISALSGLLDDAVEVQFERGTVRRWVCVDFSSLSFGKSLRLIDMVVHMCVKIGMIFYPCPLMLARVKPASLGDIGNILLDMRQKILDLLTKLEEEESAVFLLVILPDDRRYDEGIKELCEILKFTYEICYSCCYDTDWRLKITARQIQSKVVKRDVRHRRLALPLVSEAPMIIFGADMFHCMPGEHSESIATVAASLDWPKFRKYFVSESYQPYGEGIIKDLHNNNGGIMINFFNSFYKRIKQNPQRIIFFRNGLERGQFSHICQQEIDAIKRACAIFSDRYQPQLTYVVVLPTIQNARTDKSLDIFPGTEAGLTKFKFWCCHRGQKNYSSSLVCYHVVHDDNNFPAHELQSLTSKLCTFRHRWANPEIDMVPPAYYAQIAALDAIKEWRRKTT